MTNYLKVAKSDKVKVMVIGLKLNISETHYPVTNSLSDLSLTSNPNAMDLDFIMD